MQATFIIRKDSPAKSVFFIASGAVELEVASQTWRLGRGEMFGTAGCVDEQDATGRGCARSPPRRCWCWTKNGSGGFCRRSRGAARRRARQRPPNAGSSPKTCWRTCSAPRDGAGGRRASRLPMCPDAEGHSATSAAALRHRAEACRGRRSQPRRPGATVGQTDANTQTGEWFPSSKPENVGRRLLRRHEYRGDGRFAGNRQHVLPLEGLNREDEHNGEPGRTFAWFRASVLTGDTDHRDR